MADSKEIDYLKFCYVNIDTVGKIKLQTSYRGIIPENYKLAVCQSCNSHLVNNTCSICEKNICNSCAVKCPNTHNIICFNDYERCHCGRCACFFCRRYEPERVCDVCADDDTEFTEMYFCCICTQKTHKSRCIRCLEKLPKMKTVASFKNK